MKILLISPYSPLPPAYGGALRIYNLLKGLSKNNEITFLTFGYQEDLVKLESHFGNRIKEIHLVQKTWACRYRRLAQFYAFFKVDSFHSLFTRSDKMQNKIDELLAKNKYDIVQVEFPIMGRFSFKTDAVKILDEHNIEFDNFKRIWQNITSPLRKLHYNREYKKTYREEINVCRKMDAVFTVSERDSNILNHEVPGMQKFIIPNGVDTSYFRPSDETAEPFTMVFTGMMGYVPNNDGMFYFLDKIFPKILNEIPEAKIYIVGNRPPKELQKRAAENIIVTGYVDDVRPYIRRAGLYVVPLRMGGGTRLKVLEALSMGKAVVTTSIGCEGINVIDKKHVLIADQADDFALCAVNVLRNTHSYKVMCNNGYSLIKSAYDWQAIVSSIEETYKKILVEKYGTKNNLMLTELIENAVK